MSVGPAPRDEPVSPTQQLLRAFLAGEKRAEGELFERHRPQLLKHATQHPRMRALKRWTTPEDVVDEAFLRALTSNVLSGFEDRGPGSLRNVLMTIADRVLVDMWRRFKAQKRGEGRPNLSYDAQQELDTSPGKPLSSAATSPSQAALGADLLRACEALLTPRERQAWDLVALQGLSAKDAAVILETTDATVRSLLHRARERIQERLRNA